MNDNLLRLAGLLFCGLCVRAAEIRAAEMPLTFQDPTPQRYELSALRQPA